MVEKGGESFIKNKVREIREVCMVDRSCRGKEMDYNGVCGREHFDSNGMLVSGTSHGTHFAIGQQTHGLEKLRHHP